MTYNQFEVGMRVKIWDEYDKCNIYGHVTEVHPDRILIKWNDLDEPATHLKEEWATIKIGSPTH